VLWRERKSEQQEKVSLRNQVSVDFAEAARRRFEELPGVLTELSERFQEVNKRFLDPA
jgi:hypothetical protein